VRAQFQRLYALARIIEKEMRGREPSDRSRLRLFSKAPLAEVLKEEGEEPLGKTPWGLPLVAAQEANCYKRVHRLYLS